MYTCPKCGSIIGSESMIGQVYGENPESVYCSKCNIRLSIKLPYSPPLKQHLLLKIFLGIISIAELIAGFFLMSHVWNSIESTFLSFLGAGGIIILTIAIFLLSLLFIFDKQKNPYAHGYNHSYAFTKKTELESEKANVLIFLCVINGLLIAVSYFIAIRHLF